MKRKILIVEDNVGLSQMQKDWLAQAGYDAVTAMNEPIARSLIRRTQFDLILSDVRLPEGDGISLLEWLRKEKKDIPFILTTEYVSVSDVVRTIKLGARDYLPKPVHREHLLELAEDVFRPVATVRRKEKVLFHRTSPRILQVEKFAGLVAPSNASYNIIFLRFWTLELPFVLCMLAMFVCICPIFDKPPVHPAIFYKRADVISHVSRVPFP